MNSLLVTGKATNVEWKPSCRENSKDPGNSFLGTVLNADPIGNAKFVIDQVSKKIICHYRDKYNSLIREVSKYILKIRKK